MDAKVGIFNFLQTRLAWRKEQPPPRSTQVNKRLILSLILLSPMALVVLGCSQTPEQKQYSVDKYSLIRSAVYNQRELINSQLQGVAKPTNARQQLLLSNYCDLIDRRIIYSKQKPPTMPAGRPEVSCLHSRLSSVHPAMPVAQR